MVAIASYTAVGPDELSFKQGDILLVVTATLSDPRPMATTLDGVCGSVMRQLVIEAPNVDLVKLVTTEPPPPPQAQAPVHRAPAPVEVARPRSPSPPPLPPPRAGSVSVPKSTPIYENISFGKPASPVLSPAVARSASPASPQPLDPAAATPTKSFSRTGSVQGFVSVRQGPRGVTRTASVVQSEAGADVATATVTTTQPKQWTKEEVLQAILDGDLPPDFQMPVAPAAGGIRAGSSIRVVSGSSSGGSPGTVLQGEVRRSSLGRSMSRPDGYNDS